MHYKNTKIVPQLIICVLICIVLIITVAAKEKEEKQPIEMETIPIDTVPELSQEELEKQRTEIAKRNSEDAEIEKQYFHCEADIQYYAYLDYASANEAIKPVILAARSKIIYRYSWVANGLSGNILSSDGSVKQRVPEFSEVFPADWEEPIGVPCGVDTTHYS